MAGYGQTNTYKPFPKKNAIWTNRNGTVNSNGTGIDWELPFSYCMEQGDTSINSTTYSKVNYCGGVYHGALRDNKGKIYYVPKDSLNELLIYDFTLKTGDSVSVYCILGGKFNPFREFKYQHVWVDSVLIKGVYRKSINLNGYKWIEGIGNTKGLFVESFANVSGWATQLLCMSDNDTTLFPSFSIGSCSTTVGIPETEANGNIELFPNPTTGKFRLQAEKNPIKTIEIIDLYGKIIYSIAVKNKLADADVTSLSPGIYFVRITDVNGNTFLKRISKE
jgi:hypothetical protein